MKKIYLLSGIVLIAIIFSGCHAHHRVGYNYYDDGHYSTTDVRVLVMQPRTRILMSQPQNRILINPQQTKVLRQNYYGHAYY